MKNKIKKIIFSGILSLVLVFAFAFASLNVLRTDDRAHADGPFSVDFKSSSSEYYDYNNATITGTTTFADIVSAIKGANSNISSGDNINFYFCYKNPDTSLQLIAYNQFDYSNTSVLSVFIYYGASPDTYADYYFSYQVMASPSNDPGVQEPVDVSYHFEGALYLNDDDFEGIGISIDVLVDEDITIAQAEPIVSAAIEAAYPTIAVEELYLGGEEVYEGYNVNETNLSYLAMSDSTYSRIVLLEGYYGPKINNQNSDPEPEEVIEYMSSYTTPTKWIEFTPVANFYATDETVYIANSNSTTAPEVTVPQYPEAHRYVIDGMAVNNQEATLPTFAMDYTVTANAGINSILLIPEFEKDFFEIAAVKVYNTVAGWDAATITYNGYDKILLEGKDLFASVSEEEETVTLFRIYFKTKEYQVERNNETVSITGEHTFGLRVQKTEAQYYAHNHYTESYQWLEGTKLGQQEEVGVRVVYTEASKVNFFVRLTPVLQAPESNTFTYGFQAVGTQKVEALPVEQADDLVVKYVYSGNGNVTFAWSSTTAPINASETAYTLTITAAPTLEYYGASREVSVKINQKALTFAIVGGERTYAMPYQPIQKVAQQTEEPTPFTYTLSGVCAGDDAGDSVAIDLGNNTFAYDPEQGSFQAAGTYPLKAHVTNANYSFTQNEATYRINKIKITIVGENQQLTFANRDFEVTDLPHHPLEDYAGYPTTLQGFTAKFTESVYVGENALYEANANIPLAMVEEIGIQLQKPAEVQWKNVLPSGSYEVLVVPTSHTNYDLTVTNGSLTILTVMNATPAGQFIASFFEGKDVYYNAEEQDLLNVKATGLNDAAFPAWLTNVYPEEGEPTIRWTVENNLHTHTDEDGATANNDEEYVMTIRTELNYQDALNYTQGQQVFVFNVTGYLRKLHITLTANDTTSVYGDYIAEEVANNNVNYSYTVTATPVSVEPLENRDSDVHKLYAADVTRVNNRLTFTNGAVAAALALAAEEENEYGTYGEGANVGSYTLALTASELSSLTDYDITVVNGTHTVTKAPVKYVDPQAEEPVVAEASAEGSGVKITALPAEVYYNRSLQLTTLGTVKVGDLVLAPNKYDIHLEYNNHSYNQADFPWNVGDYVFVVVTLQTSSNYFGASKSATFRVNSIALAQPVVSYNKNEVTWSAVTMDAGIPGEEDFEVAPVALHNATLVYTVYEGEEAHVITPDTNGVYHYLADSTAALSIVVHSSNNANYTDSTLDLRAVHSVTYTDGSHEYNTDPNELTGMPAVEYLFHGENATEPEDPALVGYEFLGWWLHVELEEEPEDPIPAYVFDTQVFGNIQLDAHWEAIPYTITVRYRNAQGVLQTETTQIAHYNQSISATDVGNYINGNIPSTFTFESKATAVENGFTAADYGKIYGFHTWKYTDEAEEAHEGTEISAALATLVKGDCSFDAEYTVDGYKPFNITYKIAVYIYENSPENAGYPQKEWNEDDEEYEYAEGAFVIEDWSFYQDEIDYYSFTDVINSLFYGANLPWFRLDSWFLDEARNQVAQLDMVTMPNEDVTVYGALVFDIGKGDVNGDGSIDVNDITVYRQWIVGGYDIVVVEANEVYSALIENVLSQFASATWEDTEDEPEEDPAPVYFLKLVADTNFDESKDIRDVSTTRMTLVEGYGWENETGYNVSGNEIIRNEKVSTLAQLSAALEDGLKVTLANDIVSTNALSMTFAGNVTLDLNGKTLDLAKLDLRISNRGTLTIKNGTIITRGTGAETYNGGITLYAPYGNVVLEDVDCWDAQGLVNLGAGSHSLHLFGVVEFYKGTNTAVEEPIPAEVKVAKNTHIVVEEAAELVVEKLVVAKVETTAEVVEFTVPSLPEDPQEELDEEYTISITSYSTKVEVETLEQKVVGYVESKTTIETLDELLEAGQKGGSYKLDADLKYNGTPSFSKDTTIDLNGHKLESANYNALAAVQGATLTLKGEGQVKAQEACVMAFDGSHIVIEGGVYTSVDNFVLGTNGTAGRGNNTITVNGGTFNGGIQSAGYVACGIYVANSDTVVVNAGTFNVTNGVGILARSGNTTVANGVVFNVTGNGTFGKVGDSKVTVPAGAVLVLDLAANYPGGDPTLVNNTTNPKYEVVTIVATEAELRSALEFGGNIKLVGDISVTGDDRLTITDDTNLDLNGHTLKSADGLEPTNWATLWVNNDAVANISNGTIGSCYDSDGVTTAPYGIYVGLKNVSSGTVNLTNVNVYGGITAIQVTSGVANIYSGSFKASPYLDSYEYTLNCVDANYQNGTARFNVYGGSFENFNPSNNLAEGPKTNFVAAGYVVSASNDVYTVTAENETVKAIASLDDLNDARANGGNYVLMADVVYGGQASFAHNTTIELNGYKLQSTGNVALSATNGATLTLNGDGYVEAQEACVMAFDASHVVINGGTYTARDNFVLGTNGTAGRGNNTITVNGGVFNGGIQSAGYVACGIYVANSDTVVVNAGTFNVTNGVGILARSGNTTVGANVVFNVTGDGHFGKVGDSKVTVPAGAVLVWDLAANYPGGEPVLTNNTDYEVVTVANGIVNINNLAQLKAFRDDVNAGNNYAGKTVVLNANITLDGAWEAISNYSRKDSANESKWFAGTFDGRGHVISGLTNNSANIVEKEEFTYGLFGSVKNAVIKNLTLASVNISTNKGDSLGALVGYYAGSTQKSEANISNITVSGTVAGADNVGGVVGRAAGDYFKAENITVNGTVTALKKAAGVVGTGNAHEMVFANCANHAAVSSTEADSNQGYNTVAGISITWKDACQTVVLTNCSNDGDLSTCNSSSLAGQLAVDYSPKTQLNSNGTWTYANGQWTCQ